MKISTSQYAKTLLELTENKSQNEVLNIVKNFAEQLKKDGQLKNSGRIIEKFTELYNIAHGIVEADVVSARKLEVDQLSEIEKMVKDKYSATEVTINNVVDEKIKGGIIVKVGDEVIDGSIAAQLKKLKKELSK